MPNIVVSRDVDGIEMGVFEDGTSYLTGRGVARVCGVAPSAIIKHSQSWEAGGRDSRFARMLIEHGLGRESLYVPVELPNGILAYAYPDEICMAFLEYYAFEAQVPNIEALNNYRKLARAGLRLFIYASLGYDPQNRIPDKWKHLHDRLTINSAPAGYFSVFREMSDIIMKSIQHGLIVDVHTVPDISVGKAWATRWEADGLALKHGERRKFPHKYPEYFPQAAANAFIEASVYPLAALGDFRIWLENEYLPKKYPTYLRGKMKRGQLPPSTVDLVLKAFEDDAAAAVLPK